MRPASASASSREPPKEVTTIVTSIVAAVPVEFAQTAGIGVAEWIVCDYKTSTIHRESPHKSTHEQNQRQHQ
jgi:hypothetical protein